MLGVCLPGQCFSPWSKFEFLLPAFGYGSRQRKPPIHSRVARIDGYLFKKMYWYHRFWSIANTLDLLILLGVWQSPLIPKYCNPQYGSQLYNHHQYTIVHWFMIISLGSISYMIHTYIGRSCQWSRFFFVLEIFRQYREGWCEYGTQLRGDPSSGIIGHPMVSRGGSPGMW